MFNGLPRPIDIPRQYSGVQTFPRGPKKIETIKAIGSVHSWYNTPNTNWFTSYPGDTDLWLSAYTTGWMARVYIKFLLTQIPAGTDVVSAKLYLYKKWINSNGASLNYTTRRITADWVFNTLTWNNAPAYSGVYGSTYNFGSTLGVWKEHDITEMVREWISRQYPNYGVCLNYENPTGYRTDSKFYNHYSADYCPYLVIETFPRFRRF